MTDQQTAGDCAAMGALCDEHARLAPFAGTFKSRVTMWMGPGEPMTSTGTMTNRLILGGRFIEHDYTGDPNLGPFPEFAGKGYWGYNTIDKRYEGVWIDSAGTWIQFEQGQVDATGTEWTMLGTMTNPETGKPMNKRSVVRLIDNDHHTMEMYFEMPEGEFKCMEIKYERA